MNVRIKCSACDGKGSWGNGETCRLCFGQGSMNVADLDRIGQVWADACKSTPNNMFSRYLNVAQFAFTFIPLLLNEVRFLRRQLDKAGQALDLFGLNIIDEDDENATKAFAARDEAYKEGPLTSAYLQEIGNTPEAQAAVRKDGSR